jgi:hypothetical protein
VIAIYEPIYLLGQTISDPAFKPLRLEANYPEWREFRIIVDMYRRGMHRLQRFTGLMSPKFGAKTGISGKRLIDFIGDNADADVCFINPFAYLSYISFNVWTQGEVYHPGLKKRARDLLCSSGIDLEIENTSRHGPRVLCYCNFWVGSERFWDDYVGGILLPIAEFLETYPESAVGWAVLEQKTPPDFVAFLPYVIERLFSSYLSHRGSTIVCRGYPLDPVERCLTDFERRLVAEVRDEIDAADRAAHFSDELRAKMDTRCRSWKNFMDAYYAERPHPHGISAPTVAHADVNS